jgi:uncharacterized protein (DUF427 family)
MSDHQRDNEEAAMSRLVLEPTADHPITIKPTTGRVVVRIAGQVVADTSAALTLEEAGYDAVQYIPPHDIDQAVLRLSKTTTYCPYKGDAGYFSVDVPGRAPLEDVAWFYAHPYTSVAGDRQPRGLLRRPGRGAEPQRMTKEGR